jgi:hypothetical protein
MAKIIEKENPNRDLFWAFPHRDGGSSPLDYGIGFSHHLGRNKNFANRKLVIPENKEFGSKGRTISLPEKGYRSDADARSLFGFNEGGGLTWGEGQALLKQDLPERWRQAERLAGSDRWSRMTDEQRHALLDMVYQGGPSLTFLSPATKAAFLSKLQAGDFAGAGAILTGQAQDEFGSRNQYRDDLLSSAKPSSLRRPGAAARVPGLDAQTGSVLSHTGAEAQRTAAAPIMLTQAPISTQTFHTAHQTQQMLGPLTTRTQSNAWARNNVLTQRFA